MSHNLHPFYGVKIVDAKCNNLTRLRSNLTESILEFAYNLLLRFTKVTIIGELGFLSNYFNYLVFINREDELGLQFSNIETPINALLFIHSGVHCTKPTNL